MLPIVPQMMRNTAEIDISKSVYPKGLTKKLEQEAKAMNVPYNKKYPIKNLHRFLSFLTN